MIERTVSTGYGGFYVLEKIINEHTKTKPINKLTCAIQGFGKVGYWFAEIAQKMGMKIVAISNEHGGICCPYGLKDISELRVAIGPDGKRTG